MIDTGTSLHAEGAEHGVRRDRRRRGAAGCGLAVVLAFAATGAAAQMPTYNGGSGHGQSAGQGWANAPKRQAPPPEVKMAPEPWPRLDPGAVFCRTEVDLRQHLAAVSARLDGGAGMPEPTGCRLIRARTGVAVVSRGGPAQTQVKLSDAAAETGWTDAFLPEKPVGH